ncbi:MAG: protein TolR [Deltaproteobacteria bacterium]|jgi:biopolymer transport protein TolR|nr:protein TolR [Deltaproteobacteria bacterium]MBW2476927.1 protein TolR [Deltaproteobacteria bacterium]MBW2504777.1 protein TolR [Deltaproteobacteria bacterium]MBW2520699.1 protein TolR [Deltaproteobacteria bacterium]
MEVGQRENRRRTVLAHINVTPFVDVMLVLLIIFMVTAPMMERGVDVALPEVENAPNLSVAKDPVIVTLTQKGAIMIGNSKVDQPAKLTPIIEQILLEKDDKTVYLEADKAVPYGRVVQVMAAIKRAGVAKLGMVAQEPQD